MISNRVANFALKLVTLVRELLNQEFIGFDEVRWESCHLEAKVGNLDNDFYRTTGRSVWVIFCRPSSLGERLYRTHEGTVQLSMHSPYPLH